MAVMRLAVFKGLYPSASQRALPDEAATTADNISPRLSEFAPLRTDQNLAAGQLGAKTIYRHSRTASGDFNSNLLAGWRTALIPINVAKGQINDDTRDLLYLTAMDGSESCTVLTAAGELRTVGVPQPATGPAPAVNVVDELTWEERNTGYEAALAQVEKAIRDNLSEKWVGIPRPGLGTPGVVDVATEHFGESVPFMVGRLYRINGENGQIEDTYTGADPTVMSWVMDPMIKGMKVGVLSSPPAWAGSAYHYGVGLYAYGRAYSINVAAASAAVEAITLPGGEVAFPPDQTAAMMAGIVSALDENKGVPRIRKDELTNKMNEVLALFAGGARSNLIAATAQFYAKADVSASVSSAIDTFTSEVFKNALQVANTQPNPVIDPGDAP